MENLHLLRPYMLLLLVPALLAVAFLFYRKQGQNNWDKVCDNHLLKHLRLEKNGVSSRLPIGILLLLWIITVIAVSGPAWRQAPQPAYRNQSAMVVVLDLSNSMLAQDIKPSRIERAKYKVIDLLEKNKDGQLSLVVFAGDAHAVTPLTDDINTIKSQIEPLGPSIMPFPGSRPDQGIIKALELLKNAAAKDGVIVLLTDGTEAYWQQLEDIAADVNAAGHTLSIIGIGTESGAPIPAEGGGFVQDRTGAIVLPKLDESRLKQVVHEGGGYYTAMTVGDSDMDAIAGFSQQKKMINKENKQQVASAWADDGYWLVLLILPFALYCFRKGVVFSFMLVFITIPDLSYASENSLWTSLWQRPEQIGIEQINSNQYEDAEKNLQNTPLWKGVAQYRAGKFEEAVKTLEKETSAIADYNRGNSLAHLGRYEEAIAAYTQALEKDPENQDAIDNKKLIEEQLQQQQPEQQQSSDDKKCDNPKQDGEQGEGDQSESKQESQQQESQDSKQQDQQQESQSNDSQQQQSGQQNDSEKQQDLTQQQKGEEQEQEKQAQEAKKLSKEEKEQLEQDAAQQMVQEDPEQPPIEKKPLDQKTEQWLRQIPDNPGGLLKRKFYNESKKKYDKGTLPDIKNKW